MSWLDSDLQRRIPVTVDNNGGSATIDVSVPIPSVWPDFWDNVASNGHDIKVTGSDGVTPVTWQRDGFNHANKTLTIEVNDWSPASSNATVILWLYWDHSGSPTDTSGSFTVASPKTGTVRPSPPPPTAIVMNPVSLPVGEDVPVARYSWPPGQEGGVYWNLAGLLATHPTPYEGKLVSEEVSAIQVETRNGGQHYADGYESAETRLCVRNGELYAMMWLDGGVDNNDYLDEITITTTEQRELLFSAVRFANTAEES